MIPRAAGLWLAAVLWMGGAGCRSTPAERTAGLVAHVASEAGLPSVWEDFHLGELTLRPEAVSAQYVRAAPPAQFYVLRFARSAQEQRPELFRDFEGFLAQVARGADPGTFAVTARRQRVTTEGALLEAACFTLREHGRPCAGTLCLWEEPRGGGAWVNFLRTCGREEAGWEFLERLLAALGAPLRPED